MIVTDLPFKGSDEEVRNQIIDHVIQRLARSCVFGYYTVEDIYQQAWVIALVGLDSGKYDIRRPMEKFLYVHIWNRLRNLYRDECFRKQRANESRESWEKRSKKKASLMSVAEYIDEQPSTQDVTEDVAAMDLSAFIRVMLPDELQTSYDDLLNDQFVPNSTKQFLRELISEILLDV